MDYTEYSVEDLASDESFVAWANRCNPIAEQYWDAYLAQHPEMTVKINQARTLVLNLRQAEVRRHTDDQIHEIWSGIQQRIAGESLPPLPASRRAFRPYFAFVAATVIAVMTLVTWYALEGISIADIGTGQAADNRANDFIEEVNTSGSVLRVHLSDGSTVSLENGGRLKYKANYRGDPFRTVYLEGEAFFEVAKDPSRPFLVYANDVVTRVLGTSFRVIAPDANTEVTVSVKTGKVSVYALNAGEQPKDAQRNGVILLPNQQVTYIREQATFGKTLVDNPEIVTPSVKETDFTFENTPVTEVFRVLEEAYGIEIIFDEEVMNRCFITAPLGSEPLFEKLKIICRTVGARYETIDARVVVTSTGC